MSKTVVITEEITLSFWGFLKHQRFGWLAGIATGLALAALLRIWL